jgi:hypothetical protein
MLTQHLLYLQVDVIRLRAGRSYSRVFEWDLGYLKINH